MFNYRFLVLLFIIKIRYPRGKSVIDILSVISQNIQSQNFDSILESAIYQLQRKFSS